MKKYILIGIILAVIVWLSVHRLFTGSGRCNMPLLVTTSVVSSGSFNSLPITDSEFHLAVASAIDEWETKTGLNLFTLADKGTFLDKSGLESTVKAIPKSLSVFDLIAKKPNEVGRTRGETDSNGAVTHFSVEIYDVSKPTLHELLVHELGHSFGLQHSSSSLDIMYYKIVNPDLHLSANDIKMAHDFCQK